MRPRNVLLAPVSLFAWVAVLAGAAMPCAFATEERAVAPQKIARPELQLELAFPAFDELAEQKGPDDEDNPWRAGWVGSIDDSRIEIGLYEFSSEDVPMVEPEDVTDRALYAYKADPNSNHRAVGGRMLDGDFGIAPYAHLVNFHIYDGTEAVGEMFFLGALHEGGGYGLEVSMNPKLAGEQRAQMLTFLEKGIEFLGEVRDPEWSEEEVEARMQAEFTEAMMSERLRAHRTKHYIVLGNSSGAKTFGNKLEEYYDLIQKTYGFEEMKGRRLMPVFLWRTRDDYLAFTVKNTGFSPQQAAATAGYAWKDFYTTMYDSPADPTHIHELTHQLMKNRLRMMGGGSWFHEGCAVYMEAVYDNSSKAEMFEVGKSAPGAEEGDRIDFKTLMTTPTLAFDSTGKGGAGKAYNTAGTIMWFITKDKRTKDKVMEYMYAMADTSRIDLAEIEAGIQRVFGVNLETFEQWYLEFWKRPKK